MTKEIISGAGLVGSLLAVMLKRRGLDVEVFEKRPDMRKAAVDAGRSINLVVTSRGIHALKKLNLWETVKNICVPVMGRMMHSTSGELTYQPYGKDDSECNYSVSRAELNKLLMTVAEKEGVKIHFEHSLEDVDTDKNVVTFRKSNEEKVDVTFAHLYGCDGAGSNTRKALIKAWGGEAKESMELLVADYKELFMPAKADGSYAIEKNALHIWPRGKHMLMALPNQDGSFTMTLYLPKEGKDVSFQNINTKEDVKALFEEYYSDAIPLMPDYAEEYFANPQGILGTVRCNPWNYRDKIVLFGDAAHAVVPFFGQGMNCGFEDCIYLQEFLDNFPDDWEKAFSAYNEFQKPNGDAIADMAIENFTEMADSVGNEKFLLRKKVDSILEKEFPDVYRTRYALVVYTLVTYSLAQKAGRVQQEILDELCNELDSIDNLDLKKARDLIDKKFVPFVKENNIKLERYIG